jgi:hypothetical protein
MWEVIRDSCGSSVVSQEASLAVGARPLHDPVPGTFEMLLKSYIQLFKSLRPFGFVSRDNQGAQFSDFVFSTEK